MGERVGVGCAAVVLGLSADWWWGGVVFVGLDVGVGVAGWGVAFWGCVVVGGVCVGLARVVEAILEETDAAVSSCSCMEVRKTCLRLLRSFFISMTRSTS